MRCDALMSANPVAVRDTASVAEATELLLANRQLGLPVVQGERVYLGMFGTDDLAGLIVPRVAIAGNLGPNLRFIGDDVRPLAERFRELKNQPVRQVADKNAVVVSPDTSHIEAFRIFCRSHAPLPVVDPTSRRLLGVVSYWDVMKAITAGA